MDSRQLWRITWVWILSVILVACGNAGDIPSGPRLLSDVTIGPATEVLPTLIVTDTPVRLTPEIISPLEQVTVDADFVLVTPTLPPSKTPTQTPTLTQTPTITPTPTTTLTPNATLFLLPTSNIVPVTQAVAVNDNRICESSWFFIQPRPAACPLFPPTASQGVYQEFQNGYMVWVAQQDAIYVLYKDNQRPRWEVQTDFFNEGMERSSSAYDNAPAPNLWQPVRGFGLVWRNDGTIRNRIGWAIEEFEQPYSLQVQVADNGTTFISRPGNTMFALLANGTNWRIYDGTNTPGNGANATLIPPGSVPFPTVRPPGL